jgi:predicted glycoside hydrolase/deacetylase ChbG (UPF0249 family)
MIISNADDFGRSNADTEAAAALVTWGRVTSVSGMVFMEDSERAAEVATRMRIDVGLHLNFCEPWNGGRVTGRLAAQHESLVTFFNRSHYARLTYNPRLRNAFKAVYEAQVDEFQRLYKREPSHIDGHHHLHLCPNMLFEGMIPRGVGLRRNFTFAPGEKGPLNRAYRGFVDMCLRRRYVLTDYFFSLEHCLSGQGRPLRAVAELGRVANVEIMTHPRNANEFDYLVGPQCTEVLGMVPKGTYAGLSVKRLEERFVVGATLLTTLCEWTSLYEWALQ